MALRIRFQHPTGSNLGYSIERLADGLLFDFPDRTFKASPGSPIAALPEDGGIFLGRYKATLTPTPADTFTDGDYTVTVHDRGAASVVVGELAAMMHGGDDATMIPQAGPTGIDPWSTNLPGSYPPGSAGAIVGRTVVAQNSFVESVAAAVAGMLVGQKVSLSLAGTVPITGATLEPPSA